MSDFTSSFGLGGNSNAGLNPGAPSPASRYTTTPLTTSVTPDFSLTARSSQREFSPTDPTAPVKQSSLLWRDEITGRNVLWLMDGTSAIGSSELPTVVGSSWKVEATADFNRDGQADLLWRDYASGQNVVWLINGTTTIGGAVINSLPGTNWQIEAAADFNQDGQADLLWRDYASGQNVVWFMNGTTPTGGAVINSLPGTNWQIEAAADFNQDGQTDLLWRDYNSGTNAVWYLNETTVAGSGFLTQVSGSNWSTTSLEVLLPPPVQEPAPPGTRQLTNNQVVDQQPRIFGNTIVWSGWDGNDFEIYMAVGGANPIQITNNNREDLGVQISGNYVVWQSRLGNNIDIYYYDGNRVGVLAGSELNEMAPQISGSVVAWQTATGSTVDIYMYDFSMPNQPARNLTNNTASTTSYGVRVSGGRIVWEHVINQSTSNLIGHHIAVYEGIGFRLLTNNTDGYPNFNPIIGGNAIAWERILGASNPGEITRDIYYYSTANPNPVRVATSITADYEGAGILETNTGSVIWSSRVNGQEKLFRYTPAGGVRELTVASQQVYQAKIVGNSVVWLGTEVGIEGIGLYVFDSAGSRRTRTVGSVNTNPANLDATGSGVVWQAFDGNDTEIVYTSLTSIGP